MQDFNSKLRTFYISCLLFMGIFVILAFVPVPSGRGSYYFVFTILIFGGWVGFALILISFISIKSNYQKITTSYKMFIVAIVLIIFNYLFFVFLVWTPRFSVYLYSSIFFIVSIVGFFISLFFLKKAKVVYNNNYELIQEIKKGEEIEKQKKKLETLYCPRCSHRIEGDVTSCAQCDLNFTVFPPMAYSQVSRLRYCPRCQKNVQKKRKFGVSFWIALVLLIIFVFTFVGGIGMIAVIGLFLFTAISSPRCSICKKKTQPPQFTTQQMAPNP